MTKINDIKLWRVTKHQDCGETIVLLLTSSSSGPHLGSVREVNICAPIHA